MCFFGLILSASLVRGSKVNAALGPLLLKEGSISLLFATEARITTSKPGRKEVLGNFSSEDGLLLLHTADANAMCTDAILYQPEDIRMLEDQIPDKNMNYERNEFDHEEGQLHE